MHLKYVIYAGGRPSHGVAKGYSARRTFVVLRGGMFDLQGWTLDQDERGGQNGGVRDSLACPKYARKRDFSTILSI